jgi:hypothetical protein
MLVLVWGNATEPHPKVRITNYQSNKQRKQEKNERNNEEGRKKEKPKGIQKRKTTGL